MTLENHHLLRPSSMEVAQSPSRQHHLNRTMSLHAALLAFPLPNPPASPPRPPTSLDRPRISPLQTYNSNYTHFTQARALRLQQRQSQLHDDPAYAMPSSYSDIQRTFPQRPSPDSNSIKSMAVEIGESIPFEIFQDPIPKRASCRATLLSSGSIARKQRVRRKLREKTPKEISTNFVRNTSVIVGKTVQKAKGAISMVKVSTEHLGKIVKGFGGSGNKSEGENGRDELHENTHDIHKIGIEGAKNLDLENFIAASEIDPKNEIEGRDGSDMVGGYDNGRRRQTWTNLSSVLMDSDMQDAGVDGHNVENEELPTIEEICETSPCARRPSGQRNEVSEIPALEKLNLRETEAATKDDRATRDAQKIKRYLESLALALKAKTAAEQRESIDYSTPVQEPISPDRQPLLDSFNLPSSQTIIHKSSIESLISHGSPFPTNWDTVSDVESNANKSLRQLSPATQDIFNVTHAATMCYSATSDPIKSSISTHSPYIVEVANPSATPDDRSSEYSEILPPEDTKQRQISYLPILEPRQPSTSTSLNDRLVSTPTLSRDGQPSYPSSLSERQFHSSLQRSDKPASFPSSPTDGQTNWSPEAFDLYTLDVEQSEDGVKSVRERVKELDRAIEQAMSFESSGKPQGGKKTWGFRRWRN